MKTKILRLFLSLNINISISFLKVSLQERNPTREVEEIVQLVKDVIASQSWDVWECPEARSIRCCAEETTESRTRVLLGKKFHPPFPTHQVDGKADCFLVLLFFFSLYFQPCSLFFAENYYNIVSLEFQKCKWAWVWPFNSAPMVNIWVLPKFK